MRLPVVLSLISLLILASCGGKATTSTRFIMPRSAGGRICANHFNQARNYCKKNCELEQRACVNSMQAQAIKDYEQYAREQFMLRGELELLPRDFERPGQCAPTSCDRDCKKSHESCYESCGGKVIKASSCRYFCFR